MEAAERVLLWAAEHGASCAFVEARLSPTCFGVGLFARARIAAGTTVLVLPRELVVNRAQCYRSLPALKRLSPAEFSFLTLVLVAEILQGKASRFHPYVQSLPARIPNSLSFTPSQMQLLQGIHAPRASEPDPMEPDEEEEDQKQRSFLHQAQLVKRRVAASRAYLLSLSQECKDLELSLTDAAPVDWALATVVDRGFSINGTLMLLPVIDICNHSSSGCKVQFSAEGDAVVRASKTFEIGEEIFVNYGLKNDAQLFASHGFTLVGPPPFNPYEEEDASAKTT
eukprot:m.77471 g.77471  ORF g.77471 m.77471 type:complete len:283 (-) comp50507_c0_seq2:1740-2588(-)